MIEIGSGSFKDIAAQVLPGIPLGEDILSQASGAKAAIVFLGLKHHFNHTPPLSPE
ncbi:MAG: hypothetical protein HY235_04240 [Acidobacteria bacterium]|nr:hypothetical protein [Acidobacteriota bacterium]